MARKKISAQQTELHADDIVNKNTYTEAVDAVNGKDKSRAWFERGVNDAKIYLAQIMADTHGYDYNETLWWINTKHSEQALVEYKRGFATLVQI